MAIRKKAKTAPTAENAEGAEKSTGTARKSAAKKATAKKVAAGKAAPRRAAIDAAPIADAVAIMRGTRQSPYKMRLVIDQIRGKNVNEALGLLRFSKKHAAVQIEKTLNSAVANAEHAARQNNESLDVDTLYIKHAIVNEGPKIKRFMPAAQGRATPIQKRTSHVHIVVGAKEGK
jgi:large subunit ribosomal protein L22